MMTGPQHYAEAERLVALAAPSGAPVDMQMVAEAQVNATLALAAATAETTMATVSGPAYGYGYQAPTSEQLGLPS
jgi:hypothetical protein